MQFYTQSFGTPPYTAFKSLQNISIRRPHNYLIICTHLYNQKIKLQQVQHFMVVNTPQKHLKSILYHSLKYHSDKMIINSIKYYFFIQVFFLNETLYPIIIIPIIIQLWKLVVGSNINLFYSQFSSSSLHTQQKIKISCGDFIYASQNLYQNQKYLK